MTAPVEIRDDLARVLRRELVGPSHDPSDPHAQEVLPEPPSRWYLTGFLVPGAAPEEVRHDPESVDEIDQGDDQEASGDDANEPEKPAARKVYLPSSLGLSVLVPPDTATLHVQVRWADYKAFPAPPAEGDRPDAARRRPREKLHWRRVAKRDGRTVPLDGEGTWRHEVRGGDGLRLVIACRNVHDDAASYAGLVPAGTRSISVFVVNERPPAPAPSGTEAPRHDEHSAFQVELTVRCDEPFVARPDVRGRDTDDRDEQVAELQHRDAFEYAVGHGVATQATLSSGGECFEVATATIPEACVEKVVPAEFGRDVVLGMAALSQMTSAEQVRSCLQGLVDRYDVWIDAQRRVAASLRADPTHPQRGDVADDLVAQAVTARDRIIDGLACLEDPDALLAFRTMNAAMDQAQWQRSPTKYDRTKGDLPRWYPFQIAFILMNLRGVVTPGHADRRTVDLLFFPTGGGKTEAYLGIAAFTLLLRRLRGGARDAGPSPSVPAAPRYAGVSVLMRYTLRLLTQDQFERAATLVCALELTRRAAPATWGQWPFEIGLWVGSGATPNEMGHKGDGRDDTARARTIAHQKDSKRHPPLHFRRCPWCGTAFTPRSFVLSPDQDHPRDLRLLCLARGKAGSTPACPFANDQGLPLLGVDEPIYRRLPCFLIATVDKFANLPWVGRAGALLGHVDHFDDHGFYGPADGAASRRSFGAPLPSPDLVIQDELHLISGPLGTMVGLYETAIDRLCERTAPDGSRLRPKIIASTATVRRAEAQIRALFCRQGVEVFPPPGADRRDSFFARTAPAREKNPRLYLGVAAQGRSLKVVLLRTYLALLGAAERHWQQHGAEGNAQNPADPYMTLLGYFNSLRELGGSRRIVEDEVTTRLRSYDTHHRVGVPDGGGDVRRRGIAEVVELTSRETNDRVAEAKDRLAKPFSDTAKRVDVALATNMISVGLDITRLGLMVVLGQPKQAAEYIQATSRVGRLDDRPGLVVTLLNVHRPRDRSHYERFAAWHTSFYRSVEATSVTPFASRALDRGLAAVLVALARHGVPALSPARGAGAWPEQRKDAAWVTDAIGDRAAAHQRWEESRAGEARTRVRALIADLDDTWARIAMDLRKNAAALQYQREVSGPQALLHTPLDAELKTLGDDYKKFRARRSLRDVEPNVGLWIKLPDGRDLDEEGET